MNKFLMYMTVLLISFIILAKYPVYGADNIRITLDGQEVTFDDNTGYPFVDENNRTLVPFRATLESFGAEVSWDKDTKTAICNKNGIRVEVTIDSSVIKINGESYENDTAAVIKEGRTYLPIRAVLEAYGCSLGWDGQARIVAVTSPTTFYSADEDSIYLYIPKIKYRYSIISDKIYTFAQTKEGFIYPAFKKGIMYAPLDGSKSQLLYEGDVAWVTDAGDDIIYTDYTLNGIYAINKETLERRLVVTGDNYPITYYDGVVYYVNRDSIPTIYSCNLEVKIPTNLNESTTKIFFVNNGYIYYLKNINNTEMIYQMTIGGKNPRLLIENGGEISFVTEDSVFYGQRSKDGLKNELWRYDIQSGKSSFVATGLRTLYYDGNGIYLSDYSYYTWKNLK